MFKKKRTITIGHDLSKMNREQLQEITLGISNNLPISKYADRRYPHRSMRLIREALMEGIDPTPYINHKFNTMQIHNIVYGIRLGIDVSKIAKHSISSDKMYKMIDELLLERKAEKELQEIEER